MIQLVSKHLHFRFDPLLPSYLKKIIEQVIASLKFYSKSDLDEQKIEGSFVIDFISQRRRESFEKGHFSICVGEQNQSLFLEHSLEPAPVFDAYLDENMTLDNLVCLIQAPLNHYMFKIFEHRKVIGLKNLKKIEDKVKKLTKDLHHLDTGNLLSFSQALIGMEREFYRGHTFEDLKIILKKHLKTHFPEVSATLYLSYEMLSLSPGESFFILPSHRGEIVGVDIHGMKEIESHSLKIYALLQSLISFFHFQDQPKDHFLDGKLWDQALDALPFPTALLSNTGEVLQHNSLFSKLNYPPTQCLKLKSKDKILINDIPYNIFHKEIYHVDREKNLFVFFTESFYLKGDEQLGPSGQELGIISSSIAHELNNPIAGIQAALAVIELDDGLGDELRQIIDEMKKGSLRCKQLVETFLGFSRVSPGKSAGPLDQSSIVEFCYQQAQNLLRFRTVESGIRFNFEFIKHHDLRVSVNPSLLTMTFYLILGEMMTLYSHQMLVIQKNQIDKVIFGEIVESSREIQIQLTGLNISDLTISKLIENLITIEKFVLQKNEFSLRLISEF